MDLGSNFCANEKDVGKKTRAEASIEKLKEVNREVEVQIVQGIGEEEIWRWSLVVCTQVVGSIEQVQEINQSCRKHNIPFLFSLNFGGFGFAFSDFGPSFEIK